MNSNVLGIGHVAYTTARMDEMLNFYCDLLGFENSFCISDESGKPWIQYVRIKDCQFLELFYANEGFEPKEGTYAHLCIQVSDLLSMEKLLKDNKLEVFWGPKQGGDKNWQCWSKDPDGNLIEFMQIDPESPQARAARGL